MHSCALSRESTSNSSRINHPCLVGFFSHDNRAQFIELWRYDVSTIIDSAQAHDIPVVLMTYHINPTYLPPEEFEKMAHGKNIPLVRNDWSFQPLIESSEIREYVLAKDRW